MTSVLFTIGHSTRSLPDFVDLLATFGIDNLIDIRSYPGSRKFPHFNKETLPDALEEYGIAYWHIPKLGGRRRKDLFVDPTLNAGWRHVSFRNYADYMQTEEFGEGVSELLSAAVGNTAFMCSEAVPWRCHRQLVADALVGDGFEVEHILSSTKGVEHVLGQWGPKPVSVGHSGQLIYPKMSL